MPLNDNITLYVTIPYFPPTCFGLHQDLLIIDLNRSFSRVHTIYSFCTLCFALQRTKTEMCSSVFMLLSLFLSSISSLKS